MTADGWLAGHTVIQKFLVFHMPHRRLCNSEEKLSHTWQIRENFE